MVSEENGDLTLKRVAVGDHILLGGDNMDLALARVLQQRLEALGNRIDTWQLHGLWHQCRIEKEKLFESPKTQKRPITLLGKGTKLIGGTIKTELVREDLDRILVEGFFPKVASGELPVRQRRVGFQELGLPTMRPIQPSPSTWRGFWRSKFATVLRQRTSGVARADSHAPPTSCSMAE